MRQTITRLRATTTENRYGDAERAWTNPDRLDISGCLIAPRAEGEDTANGRQGVIVGLTVYAPAGADVVATDRVEVAGVVHTVEGQPADWSGGFGSWQPGVELRLKAVTG